MLATFVTVDLELANRRAVPLSTIARGFGHAAAMAEAHGFRPWRHPHDYWIRTG